MRARPLRKRRDVYSGMPYGYKPVLEGKVSRGDFVKIKEDKRYFSWEPASGIIGWEIEKGNCGGYIVCRI